MPGYHLLSIQVYDRLAGLYDAVITRVSLRAFVTSHISASENPDVKCYIEGFSGAVHRSSIIFMLFV